MPRVDSAPSLAHEDVGAPAAAPCRGLAPQNFDRASPEFRRHPVGETLTGVAVPRRGQVSHHRKGWLNAQIDTAGSTGSTAVSAWPRNLIFRRNQVSAKASSTTAVSYTHLTLPTILRV